MANNAPASWRKFIMQVAVVVTVGCVVVYFSHVNPPSRDFYSAVQEVLQPPASSSLSRCICSHLPVIRSASYTPISACALGLIFKCPQLPVSTFDHHLRVTWNSRNATSVRLEDAVTVVNQSEEGGEEAERSSVHDSSHVIDRVHEVPQPLASSSLPRCICRQMLVIPPASYTPISACALVLIFKCPQLQVSTSDRQLQVTCTSRDANSSVLLEDTKTTKTVHAQPAVVYHPEEAAAEEAAERSSVQDSSHIIHKVHMFLNYAVVPALIVTIGYLEVSCRRLRSDLKEVQQAKEQSDDALARANINVEQLRRDLETLQQAKEQSDDALARVNINVEQLRRDLETLQQAKELSNQAAVEVQSASAEAREELSDLHAQSNGVAFSHAKAFVGRTEIGGTMVKERIATYEPLGRVMTAPRQQVEGL